MYGYMCPESKVVVRIGHPRDVDEGKRKELTRCLSERARMAAAGEFASEDVVNAVLLEAQAKHGAKEEV